MDVTKVIFEKILKEHKALVVQKIQEMFQKQEQFILALISGNNSLKNQHLDSLIKDINDLKESLEFSKNDYDDKFKDMGDKVQKLEEEINLIKPEQNKDQNKKVIMGDWNIYEIGRLEESLQAKTPKI